MASKVLSIAQGLKLPAAPFDAMSYNGMQINGNMENSQFFGTSAVNTTGGVFYVIDQWQVGSSRSGATFSSGQSVSGSYPNGFFAALPVTVTAGPFTTFGASEFVFFRHLIEGYRCRKLMWGTAAAIPVTVGFWLATTVTGITATFNICNNALTRTYYKNFTVLPGWNYYTLTIPGDTTGTWVTDSGKGMLLTWCFGAGSTYNTGVDNGAWQGGATVIGTPQTSPLFWGTVNNAAYLTGVNVLPGVDAPTAAQSINIQRPYGPELALCQRYWEQVGMTMVVTAPPYANTAWYRATKRISPTINLLQGSLNSATVGVLSYSPLDGMRQIGSATGAVDASFSIDARLT